MGSPHVVDHGPENVRSPDGKVYVVAGCLRRAKNCTWISGDGIFLARASFDAADPDSLNDASNWEFMGVDGWVGDVDDEAPRLFCVTAPTTHAWANEGPYDTFVLEAPRLTGPFSLVTYMPKFGMQAYFVSAPSAWMADTLNDGDFDAVLTFSANFACNIGAAREARDLRRERAPVRFLGA
ncbi:Beta-lactamase class C-like protein [Aureococcus anophagefferens]|nr:Beta-lactamase class C-like protein [Aureococcus anophagefferens]